MNALHHPNHYYEDDTAWFCLRTRNKAEHIASSQVRLLDGVETFCPRVRYHKATARGKVLFQQAMFPGYLFARFHFETQSRLVLYSHGVTGLVHFGNQHPTLDPQHIDFIRNELGPGEVKTLKARLEPGDEVEIANGPLRGLQAVIQYYMPAKQRVQVLMEILGSEKLVEIPCSDLVGMRYE